MPMRWFRSPRCWPPGPSFRPAAASTSGTASATRPTSIARRRSPSSFDGSSKRPSRQRPGPPWRRSADGGFGPATPLEAAHRRRYRFRPQTSRRRHAMARYNDILETVGHTPVVRINRLAPEHVNLFVKVEAFNPLGSVKDRLALGVIEAAEASGELKPGQTVIEATSGNTGIGLAMVCAAKGYPLVVTMAESFSVERRKLMRFLGAKVVITPAPAGGTGMVQKAIELANENGWFLTRQFENEANADMHSRTTAKEIVADFAGKRLDYWVTGFGTGGTLKGVARVLAKERPETKIVLSEPADAPMVSSHTPQA